MYISKSNRKMIDELKKDGVNLSDNHIMTILKKAKKKANAIKIQNQLDEILENDPLGIL